MKTPQPIWSITHFKDIIAFLMHQQHLHQNKWIDLSNSCPRTNWPICHSLTLALHFKVFQKMAHVILGSSYHGDICSGAHSSDHFCLDLTFYSRETVWNIMIWPLSSASPALRQRLWLQSMSQPIPSQSLWLNLYIMGGSGNTSSISIYVTDMEISIF